MSMGAHVKSAVVNPTLYDSGVERLCDCGTLTRNKSHECIICELKRKHGTYDEPIRRDDAIR